VDLQEATSEPACAGYADRLGIRVAEYCLMINSGIRLYGCGGRPVCVSAQAGTQRSEVTLWVT
jgi:hypothetical protein